MNDNGIIIEMNEILADISKEVTDSTKAAVKSVSNEAAKKLRATSPKQKGGKHSGRYARGWRNKVSDTEAIVYNATDPGLTHLLEKGHAVVSNGKATGKRARAIKHIEPVEEWAAEELPKRILEGIE